MSQPMTPDEKIWIDSATLYKLLERWRFAHPGSRWFTGETGGYYSDAMNRKRAQDPEGWTAASKAMGWGQ